MTASRGFVCCAVFGPTAAPKTPHKEDDVKVGKETVKRCSIFKNISCADHQKVYEGARSAYDKISSTPTIVIADADAKEFSRKVGALASTELLDMMKAAVKKVGPGLSIDEWQKMQADVAKANAEVEKGKVVDAIKTFDKLAKSKNEGVKALGDAGLAAINEKGNKAIDEAIAMPNVEDAKKALKKIKTDYTGTEVSKRAADELKRLEGPPKPDR